MVSDQLLKIKDMEGTADEEFEYDHCLWSFDGFKENKGVRQGLGPKYASQGKVWEVIGAPALDLACEGFNVNVVGYG